MIFQACVHAFRDSDWDRALRLIEEARGDTIWSAGRELLEAYVVTARHGPKKGLPLLELPRRRLLAAGDAQWVGVTTFWVPEMLAGEARSALEQAEAAVPLLTRDPSLPSIAPVVAISAARAVSDQPALWRWIDLSLAPPGKLLRYVRGRDAFARGERAVLEGDLDTAINLLKEGVDTFSEGLLVLPVLMLRLRRAELLPQRGGLGDREGAQAELDAVVAYWRKAKATWYLGKLQEWAAERGLRFAGN